MATSSRGQASFVGHPAAAELDRVFAAAAQMHGGELQETGITRQQYLDLMAGNIDHWKAYQNESGAIIDPYSNGERQYSTPAFALAAALLATESNRADLMTPAVKAMTWATQQLVAGKAADGHADFYIPLLIHTRRVLKGHVDAATLATWDEQLRRIDPTKTYNMQLKNMNWNLVSSSGELLRRQDGLVDPAAADAQFRYLEERLTAHQKDFTKYGMYADPGVPMAYDAFSRLWLEDVVASGAYHGASAKTLEDFLRRGSLSTLLLLSPTGEWATGGRSSQHNWCEAEVIAICEMEAKRWQQAGRADVAGALKRAAHLAFTSMQHWQRPSGELYIVKNRYEPEKRFAFERYSNHSQYNLLPMAMLAVAYLQADETISERPTPAEVGGYVFDLRDTFHKVVAAAGGYQILIDTAADPDYNATGIQRVHRAGVWFSPLSDSAAEHRGYGKDDGPASALVPGLQWQEPGQDRWHSLGDGHLLNAKAQEAQQAGAVKTAELTVQSATPDAVQFNVAWTFVGIDERVREAYTLRAAGVEATTSISGQVNTNDAVRVVIPVTAFDGKEASTITIEGRRATVEHRGSVLTWAVSEPVGDVRADEGRTPAHPGLLQLLVADLPKGTRSATWTLTLESKQPTTKP